MDFWTKLLQIMNTQMETPTWFGWFHIMWLCIMVATTVLLCVFGRKNTGKTVCNVMLWTSVGLMLLEVYKQINYTFGDGSGEPQYLWYAFPWQFCSTPVYAGFVAGIVRKGRVHDALCAYMATFGVFAALAVMIYPGNVYTPTMGINIQTMLWHGAMVTIGLYLFASGHVKLAHKTVLKALPVFALTVAIAAVMNEVAYQVGLLENHNFNMFYISPYCEPNLPVYSIVQQHVPYPYSLAIYILGFTAAAYIVQLLAMLLFGSKRKASALQEV